MANPVRITQLPCNITSQLSQASLLSALQQNFAAIVAGLQATQGYCNNAVAPAINLSSLANSEILGSQVAGFARPSVAYTEEGVQVQTHIPRYEQIDTNDFYYGLLLEEGTTNLITDPVFAISADWPTQSLAMFTTPGGFIQGTCVCLCVGASATGYCMVGMTLTSGTSYTLSCYVKMSDGSVPVGGTGTNQVCMELNSTETVPTVQAVANGWYKLSITLTGSGSSGFVGVVFTSNNTKYPVFSNIQLEMTPRATSWINSTRSPESMIIPTAGIFTLGSWTVEMRYTPKINPASASSNLILWDCYTSTGDRYCIYANSGTGYLSAFVISSGTVQQINGSAPLLAGMTYSILFSGSVSGSSSSLTLCCNGIQAGQIAYAEATGTLPAWMQVGCRYNYIQQCNGILDDLRISNVAHNITDHKNYISSNQPLPVDANTTLKMDFDQTLRQTSVQRLTNVQGTFTIADALTTSDPSKATHIVPTGWTTAEATIMQAMSELPATGGSIVLLDGTFWVDGKLIMMSSSVTLTGQGASTVIKLINSAPTISGIIIDNAAVTTTGLIVSNLTVNGNNANQSNLTNGGIYFTNTTAPTITTVTLQNVYGPGFGSLNVNGIALTNSVIQGSTADGTYINYSNNSTISGNTMQTSQGYGLYIFNCTYCTLSNNQCVNNWQVGLGLGTSSHNTVSGNTVEGNSTTVNNLYSNIQLANSSYNNVQGNTCRKGSNANLPEYGIRINDSGCTSNLINSNDCYTGGVMAGLSDSGTSTNFGSGNRVNSGAWSTTPS